MQVKKPDNTTLVVILIIMGLMLGGIITADSDDVALLSSSVVESTPPSVPYDRPVFTPSQPPVNQFGGAGPYVMVAGVAPARNAGMMMGTITPPPPKPVVPGEGVWLGMEIEGLSPGTIQELGLPQNITGVIVDAVPRGGIAEKAGLRNGDVIKVINGQHVVNMADYIKATNNQKLKSASVGVERNGRMMLIQVPGGTMAGTGLAAQQSWPQTPSTGMGATAQQSWPQTPSTGMGMTAQQSWSRAPSTGMGMTAQQSWPQMPSAGMGLDTYTGASPRLAKPFASKPVPPISVDSPMPHTYRGVCAKCHQIIPGTQLFNAPSYARVGGQTGQNNWNNQKNFALPTPAQQQASRKVLVEGHWVGMELIPITPQLARLYDLPPNIRGLLVDEVTLESAESGLLAGDVLRSINNIQISNLRDFEMATRKVELMPAVTIGVLRKQQWLTFTLRSRWGRLGASQNEAAQPIQPGALSPHQNMGRACTDCHIIMKNGGQLQKDAGDILPSPPPVTFNSQAPHAYRGQCNNCHPIIR